MIGVVSIGDLVKEVISHHERVIRDLETERVFLTVNPGVLLGPGFSGAALARTPGASSIAAPGKTTSAEGDRDVSVPGAPRLNDRRTAPCWTGRRPAGRGPTRPPSWCRRCSRACSWTGWSASSSYIFRCSFWGGIRQGHRDLGLLQSIVSATSGCWAGAGDALDRAGLSFLTYGGVSLFVVVFAVYPFAAEMFRQAASQAPDPRHDRARRVHRHHGRAARHAADPEHHPDHVLQHQRGPHPGWARRRLFILAAASRIWSGAGGGPPRGKATARATQRARDPRDGSAYPLGPTSAANLAGYCTGHHRGKHQAPGWRHALAPDGTLTVTTPTGLADRRHRPGAVLIPCRSRTDPFVR